MDVLQKVRTPVLLLVGSLDTDVLQLNEVAYAFLNCDKKLKIIDGASHLFEEGNTLSEVADEAIEWFEKYLLHVASNSRTYV
jgi:putative phosphoribosyl transferase